MKITRSPGKNKGNNGVIRDKEDADNLEKEVSQRWTLKKVISFSSGLIVQGDAYDMPLSESSNHCESYDISATYANRLFLVQILLEWLQASFEKKSWNNSVLEGGLA
jgi:hypothetical protein